MECIKRCEFQSFDGKNFYCDYYDKKLEFTVEKMNEEIKPSSIKMFRCEECIKDGIIGTSTIKEKIKKVKHRLNLMIDSFYSFKDDFDGELTEIFRTLKEIEKEKNVS